MTLKIGFLLNSFDIPRWQKEIISFLKNHPCFSIALIMLNDSAASERSTGKFLYRAMRKIDRSLFRSQTDNFRLISIEKELESVRTLNITPIQTIYCDEFKADQMHEIKQAGLDIMIRFGFRILKGEILTSAKYGIWSLHHGDNQINRGGPPAFWEVVNREPVTGVTLQILSSNLDGGKVLGRSFIKTDLTSFNRNQNGLYSAGIELFCSRLNDLAICGPEKFFASIPTQPSVSFYSHPLYRDPTNGKVLSVFVSFWLRRIREAVQRIFYEEQWVLFYKNSGSTDTALFKYKQLIPPRGVDWADPFVVKKNEEHYIFFEELDKSKKKAHISYIKVDGRNISKPCVALQEPHHLSYPLIISHQNEYYMVPEAGLSQNLWLYHCESFPAKWKKIKPILLDVELYDPTILFHDDRWYLFGTQRPCEGTSPHQYLYIYYCEDFLNGEWKPHALNPVTRDVRGARPAGRIFSRDGKLIRPSQIGAPRYGYAIRFHEIVKLSPNEFREYPVADIFPHWQKGLLGTHTFNFDEGFYVVDGQVKRGRIF